MKYLPQVAVSWEAAVLFSLLCTALGAALFALATRRKRDDGSREVKFTTKEGKERARARGEPRTIETLAESLWLRSDADIPVLSDSRAASGPSFTHPLTRTFWEEEIEPHSRLFEHRGELALKEYSLSLTATASARASSRGTEKAPSPRRRKGSRG